MNINDLITPKPTPTPTPRKKSNKLDVLDVYESKISDKYFQDPLHRDNLPNVIDYIYVIHKRKLYKLKYRTFGDYINFRWKGISRRKLYYLLQAGKIRTN